MGLIKKEEVASIVTFPPMLSSLIAEVEASYRSLFSLQVIGGLDESDTIQRFQKATTKFWACFCQTETTCFYALCIFNERSGFADKEEVLTRVRGVDERDQVLTIGQNGGIAIKGPAVFKRYWQTE